MNQLVAILDTALAANLSKRQWAAFAAVLRQTMGYRKTSDDISPRRLEQLTGIQRNHIWQAKNELLAIGLLNRAEGRYGEVLGFPALLGTHPPRSQREPVLGTEPAPPLPVLGAESAQIGRDPVPKQDTTLRNQTDSNHDNDNSGRGENPCPAEMLVLDAQALEYPACLGVEERRLAATHLDGLSPQGAQDVLDVLAVMDARGEVRKSRMGLLFALVKAQRQGVLDAAPAIQWRQQREKQRALPGQQDRLESAGERAWVQQLAALQGLPVDVVASQLGVKGWQT